MVTYLKNLNHTVSQRLSLKLRLTLLFVLIFGTFTFLYSLFLFYSLNDALLQDFDNALYNYSIDVSKSINYSTIDNFLFPLPQVDQDKVFPFSSGKALILLRDVSGQILSQNFDSNQLHIPFKSEVQKIRLDHDSTYTTLDQLSGLVTREADSYRLITFPVDEELTLFLQIAVPMSTFEFQSDRLYWFMWIGFPIVLILAMILGLYFSSRALRPVQLLINKTNEIDITHLSERLPLPIAQDEIHSLAVTQNRMLDRIEKAFQSQDRFVANASHQLLTPLTILKGEIELKIKQQNQSDPEMFSLLEEVDKLSKIVKDMLLMSRIESGNEVAHFSQLDIDDILFEAVSRLQKMAKTKSIAIKTEIIENFEPKKIAGVADLILNLFYNLIENAIKYSPHNSRITLKIIYEEYHLQIDILDEGPGLTDQQISSLFERFNRFKTAENTEGYGLGLSIARKIADLHQFKIKALDSEQKQSSGAHFQIVMLYNV